MPIRQADLARAWGVSRAYVCKCVKGGMPLDSEAKASAWRISRTTGAVGASSKGTPKRPDVGPIEAASTLQPPPGKVNASDLGKEDFSGTLARLTKNEMLAWGLLVREMNKEVKDEALILIRSRHYRDAAALRVAQEEKVDQILLRRRDMVMIEEAKALFGRHLQGVRQSLKSWSSGLAARCNPYDPDLAKQAINEAIDAIFKQLNNWEDEE